MLCMARAFTNTMETGVKNQFTADELVSHLVDAEWDDRHNRKLTRLLKGARFRYKASFEEIDFALNRNIDKNQLLRLSNYQWIESHQDCILQPCTDSRWGTIPVQSCLPM